MSLEEKKYDIEANNDWAKNVKGEHLYIDDAKSGRKGYFCIGCDKEMDAVKKKKNPNHRSYFRHVPIDISKDEIPCTFSNREYRELLATDILQRLKTIKVPAVYKYPPKDVDGTPMLLEKAKFVTAHKVKSQLTFYEDDEGAVKFGKNPDVENRYLLIRPDVVFFDANEKPILLIELVITHKVDQEKKIKLRRLGIDTVSIIVPKSSEQDIEDNFKSTQRIKWEYNENEANTNYVRVSSGTSEGVLEFDEHQKRLFEEDINCRKTRLNNTLRTIKKCLLSKSYQGAEHHFESEISRIEGATKTERQGLEDLEARFDKEVHTQFKSQFDDLERNGDVIEERRANLKQESKDLEARYFDKRRKLDQEEADISRSITEHSNLGEASERIRAESRIRKINIEAESESITNAIDRIRREIKGLPEAFKQLEIEAKAGFEGERDKFEADQRDIESKIDNFGDYSQDEERKLELEFEEFGKQSIERINKRDSKGDSELSKRIESILNAGRISSSFRERQITYERYKSYLGLARSRAWEK